MSARNVATVAAKDLRITITKRSARLSLVIFPLVIAIGPPLLARFMIVEPIRSSRFSDSSLCSATSRLPPRWSASAPIAHAPTIDAAVAVAL